MTGDPASAFPGIELSGTLLSSFTSVRRTSPRPVELREPDHDDRYDDDVLFYDVFRSAGEVVLLGPPLLDLASSLGPIDVAGQGPPTRRDLDRHAQLRLDGVPPDVAALRVRTTVGDVAVAVRPDESDRLAGRRVLLTKSKDNPIPWILDWVRFHRDVHRADAVLLYDNGSTRYDADELETGLAALAGLASVIVVRWPYKFGPSGLDARTGWDCDYGALGILEHARWRFLRQARSVVAADVDELVLTRQGPGVFARAERSPTGACRYFGRWVVDASGAPPPARDARRHRDYDVVLRRRPGPGRFGLPIDTRRAAAKWAVVPARCPAAAQWTTHRIVGWPAAAVPRPDVTFRHFRPISTGWKYDRDDIVAFDPAVHQHDAALVRTFERVAWDR